MITSTTWEVVYPHHRTPWAARVHVDGDIVHGVYDPDTGRSQLVKVEEDGSLPGLAYWMPRARLVSYRPHRRATLAGLVGGRPVYIKVVRPSRIGQLADTYDVIAPLAASAGWSIPELLSVDLEAGVMVVAGLAADTLHDRWPEWWVDFAELGRRLATFGLTAGPEDLPVRSAPDLGWWIEQVESRDPIPSAKFNDRLRSLGRGLTGEGFRRGSRLGLVHGDLHDRNILVLPGAPGLLDLDSAGRGDPLGDLATLTAHLELRALQRRQPPPSVAVAALWHGYQEAWPGLDEGAARSATAAELVRLACLYRFRRRWRHHTSELLDRSLEWSLPVRRAAASRNTPVGGPGEALRAVLQPGRLTHELSACWDGFEGLGGDLVHADVTRVVEREGEYNLQVALQVRGTGGSTEVMLLGELVAGDVEERARSAAAQLGRSSRGQWTAGSTGLVAIPGLRLLVRRPGFDRRLPVLDLLYRPDRAEAALQPYLAGGLSVELLGHRLRKRATLRVAGAGGSVIVKGYKARSDLPEQILAWAEKLRRASAPLIPAPLGLLVGRRAVVWEDVGVTPRDEWEPGHALPNVEAVGAVLRELHGAGEPNLPRHDAGSEVGVLTQAHRLLAAGRPELAGDSVGVMVRISAALLAMATPPTASVHRDAHPGQFLDSARGLVVIDLDSFSLGEPALDLGNFAAYMKISGMEADEHRLHRGYGSDQAIIDRSATWRDASLFRLGVQLALTTDRAELGQRILEGLV